MRTTWAIVGLLFGMACGPKSTLYSERKDAGTPETGASVPDPSDYASHDSGIGTLRPDAGPDSELCGALPQLGSTVPFNLVVGEGGAGPDESGGGGAGGASGAGGAGGIGNEPSGCTTTELVTTCRGPARALRDGDSAPIFVFEDGSALRWVGDAISVSPPAVAEGAEVFIDYRLQKTVVCPVCGSYSGSALTMRESEGGDILWFGQVGQPNPELDAETLGALFGTTARLELVCHTASWRYDCLEVYYDGYEHVLETTPEQRVPHAVRTRLETPRGTFDVIWASSVANATLVPNCYDGRSPQDRRDISASRVGN